jgi:hypothetical protein
MIEKYLWIAGSSVFIILAGIHLLYTFFTNKFSVRDKETEEMMKRNFPVLTKKTTMWKAWIGFNASHSIGSIFFGVINLYFAIRQFELLKGSAGLLSIMLMVCLFYLFLGFKYWFVIPRTGILISFICFVTAVILMISK